MANIETNELAKEVTENAAEVAETTTKTFWERHPNLWWAKTGTIVGASVAAGFGLVELAVEGIPKLIADRKEKRAARKEAKARAKAEKCSEETNQK